MNVRRLTQWLSALIHNAYLPGFAQLKIYQGEGKSLCVPVLNCYSCPGALGSCPVGAMQTFLASARHQISWYVAGVVTAVGALGGRWVCGWLCPFGLLQELLGSLSKKKRPLPRRLYLLKYPILLLTLLLPVIWLSKSSLGSTYYCKYICPAGTLEAGIPLGLGRAELYPLLGSLFLWKVTLLLLVVLSAVLIFRPFCRTLCPLGAYYGLFNPISLWRLEHQAGQCSNCGTCRSVCPMEIDVYQDANSPECIRCLRCRDACPDGVLQFTIAYGSRKTSDSDLSRLKRNDPPPQDP